jgi:hypothetical protein
MDKGIEVKFQDDHVSVRLGPDYAFDPSGRDEVWSEIKAACQEHNSSRVLVEGVVPQGERDTAEVVAAGQRTDTVPHLWLAFHLDNFVATEQSELFAAIAATRGVRVKFFADREHALTWLRNNAPS